MLLLFLINQMLLSYDKNLTKLYVNISSLFQTLLLGIFTKLKVQIIKHVINR